MYRKHSTYPGRMRRSRGRNIRLFEDIIRNQERVLQNEKVTERAEGMGGTRNMQDMNDNRTGNRENDSLVQRQIHVIE